MYVVRGFGRILQGGDSDLTVLTFHHTYPYSKVTKDDDGTLLIVLANNRLNERNDAATLALLRQTVESQDFDRLTQSFEAACDVRYNALVFAEIKAQAEGDAVAIIKANCEADVERVADEIAKCESDLAQAQPFVDMAINAINSITPKDINDMKANKKPVDILKIICDCLLILFGLPIERVKPKTLNIKKVPRSHRRWTMDVEFSKPSFTEYGILLLTPTRLYLTLP